MSKEQSAVKKMAMAKKMGKTDQLYKNKKARSSQEFGPQDNFSSKDLKKENAERSSKGRDTFEN